MKISENWLRTWLPDMDGGEALAERLTMAGLEVDELTQVGIEFEGVVAAKILRAEPVPESRKLQLCEVDAGEHGQFSIVCGAPNARAGLVSALAIPGAHLPGDVKIAETEVAGVHSQGMLCSESELGIGSGDGGIMELPEQTQPGSPLEGLLALPDAIIEVDLTPNRGDCLGMEGVARDIAAITRTDLQPLAVASLDAGIPDTFPVKLSAPDACPKYAGRVIRDVDCASPTPLWIRERLAAAGIRCISAVVDITNYVMIELGQPMHAFDLDTLKGGIDVRYCQPGEKLKLLDGDEVDVLEGTLVIADQSGPVALAGIMGGLDTGVTTDSRNIFLESAFFSQSALAGRARQYKLHTDASHRYERGVSFELQERAVERLSALIIEVCGGQAGPVTVALEQSHVPGCKSVSLRRARIQRLLGYAIPDEQVEDALRRLGMQVSAQGDSWAVVPPPWRFDIRIEADLIEELARLDGFDSVPAELPPLSASISAAIVGRSTESRCRELMVAMGYREAITYSFVDPSIHEALELDNESAISLANPISSEMSQMRLSLLPGLVQVVEYNANRQQTSGRFFELGRKFLPDSEGHEEIDCLAAVIWGSSGTRHWQGQETIDFFSLKGEVSALLERLGLSTASFRAQKLPGLHPGQSAEIVFSGVTIGKIGKIHPQSAATLGVPESILLFELELAGIAAKPHKQYVPITRFPSVRRDLSLVVGGGTAASDVLALAEEVAKPLLQDLQLFDVYAGEGIDSGKKSLTLGLTFQATSSTLTDEEVDAVMVSIQQALGDRLGAKLRK